jgi:peptide/nickel transport system substrate-binding protein
VTRLRGCVVATLVLAGVCGCGGSSANFSDTTPLPPGGGGSLVYAIAAAPRKLDPLRARTPSDQIVVSQVFESLTHPLRGPDGVRRDRFGLTRGWRHSKDFRVWTFRLRKGIHFQDGTPLAAAAVVANARRWIRDPAGQRLLPGLSSARAPRPDLVRFVLTDGDRRFPRRLANPRLGLISPPALRRKSGQAQRLFQTRDAGSGPFAVSRQGPTEIVLSRNLAWWGSRAGLGPALDEIVFRAVPDPGRRVVLLHRGAVRAVADLPTGLAAPLRHDALLSAVGVQSGHAVGFERSVRGIVSQMPVPLSGVWLALLDQTG